MVHPRSLHVLLVEDDAVDVLIVRRAIASAGLPWTLAVAADASAATALLRARGGGDHAWLVLLDLSLPGMAGLDCLRAWRADPALADVAVAVMSTSHDPREVRAAFALHVAGYFVKPLDAAAGSALLGAIASYWALSELPC